MEAYQVHAAVRSLEQPGKGVGMAHIVIDTLPHYILGRKSALMGEVTPLKQIHHLACGIGPLYGHKPLTLRRERRVDTYSHMHLGLREQSPQPVHLADARHRDALRAPRKPPGRGKHDIERIKGYLGQADIKVEYQETGRTFDLSVCVYKEHSQASVRITDYHTNIVQIEKNWELIRDDLKDEKIEKANRDVLSMENIWEFVRCADIEDVKETLDKQIECNMKIAREGIRGNYGANIGSILLKMEGDAVQVRAKAMAAAGSDARMNGCGLPVVINSGSGNQGITCSVPVLVYGESLNCDIEKIYRALLLSNLTAIYIKAGIGTLSAYCGAVSAGAAAGAGIAYLHGGGYEEIKHTVVNALAIVSGIVCDGAKASCAAKIASSVEAGIVGYYMYLNEQEFCAGEGIVAEGIDRTIENIGILGKEGMKETNKKIIEMMIK